MGVNVSFRDVDETRFRHFQAIMGQKGMNAGEALNSAIDLFIDKFSSKPKKKYNLTSFKPVSLGAGSEKSSSEVDEVVYGWKK